MRRVTIDSLARVQTIITGCDLVHFGHYAHGDLWKCGDAYVFNACLNESCEAAWQQGPAPLGTRQLIVNDEAKPFERRGVIVVHSTQARLNPDAEAYLQR